MILDVAAQISGTSQSTSGTTCTISAATALALAVAASVSASAGVVSIAGQIIPPDIASENPTVTTYGSSPLAGIWSHTTVTPVDDGAITSSGPTTIRLA